MHAEARIGGPVIRLAYRGTVFQEGTMTIHGYTRQTVHANGWFNKAIPGTEALARALKDTFGAFRSGLGITEPVVSVNCEGCGSPLSGHRKEVVRCYYCDRETQL